MNSPSDPGLAERIRLAARVQDMFLSGVDGDPAPFDQLALDMFAYQYRNNPPYRAYCNALGKGPGVVKQWQDIPAFPTESFKTELVTSFPFDEAVMANLTSGTTAIVRGQIFRDEIGRELVLDANRIMTGAWLFPDFEKGERCRVLILAPSPEMAPSMGMAVGMDETRRIFGTPDSRFLLSHSGIDVGALVEALTESETSGRPVAMIGSTSAFVFFFNACKKRGVSFHLPAGSRIGDGGGYRGRFGEMTQEDYLRLAYDVLGIPASHCVNVLGMAESATGYFDNTLRRAVKGLPPAKRMRQNPPWARTAA
ncbi:acyl-protein synthetase, partial [Noviherbaspirillum denitrificans]|uniref:LuxE/PaaK family acyltransferase n=1 Tax=Noviherbaspirillum denitrificans TaxID=1968433 RepID=UPI000B5307E2